MFYHKFFILLSSRHTQQRRRSLNISQTHRTMINRKTSKWWSFTAMSTRQRATMMAAMCHRRLHISSMVITFTLPNVRRRRAGVWKSATTTFHRTAFRRWTSTRQQSHMKPTLFRVADECQLQFLIWLPTLAVRSAVNRSWSPNPWKRRV